MQYVNDEGPIRTVNNCPQKGACREVSDDDPELIEFLNKADSARGAKTIEENVEAQMNSPVIRAILNAFATPEYEAKVREGLFSYYQNLK